MTTEQFKAKLEAESERKIALFEKEQAIRALLPEQYREDASIYINGDHAGVKMWNDFRTAKKLADAVAMVELFAPNIVQGEHWKDGCVSTWPALINGNAKKERAVMDGSHEIEIDVHGGKGFGPYVTVKFWAETSAGLIEFSCPVCDLWKLIPHVKADYGRDGELNSCSITWPQGRAIVDSFRAWWSEKPGFHGSYYLADVHNFYAWASNVIAAKV